MPETPILFLIFNRPDTTKAVFEKIKEIKPKYLYIAADGPRANKEGEAQICQKTRDIIKDIDWDCEVKTLFRDKNLGCKKAVSSGINWFFENVEEGIIIEDDCLPANSFFNFASQMLEKYRNDERIMHISAENPLESEFSDGDYYISKLPHIWGWASWRRAWDKYSPDMNDYNPEILNTIFDNKNDIHFWNKMFLRIKKQEIDTWDYQWTYAVLVNNGYCITPNKNQISNIGFSENATHTELKDAEGVANRKTIELSSEIKHPSEIIVNQEAVKLTLKTRYGIAERTPYALVKREVCRLVNRIMK